MVTLWKLQCLSFSLCANLSAQVSSTYNFRNTDTKQSQQNPDCRAGPIDSVIQNASLTSQYYPAGLAANSMFTGTTTTTTTDILILF